MQWDTGGHDRHQFPAPVHLHDRETGRRNADEADHERVKLKNPWAVKVEYAFDEDQRIPPTVSVGHHFRGFQKLVELDHDVDRDGEDEQQPEEKHEVAEEPGHDVSVEEDHDLRLSFFAIATRRRCRNRRAADSPTR